jgi:hypothetical protein
MWNSAQQKVDLKEEMADIKQITSLEKFIHTYKYLVSHFSSGTSYALTEIRSLSFFTYFTETDFTT